MSSVMSGSGYVKVPDDEQADAVTIMKDNGWDKGFVVFGALVSESTVKVSTAVKLLQKQENFPFKDVKWVDTPFDTSALKTNGDGSQSVGVSNETYLKITGGKGYMPAIAIDGKVIVDAWYIITYLWEQYPDKTLSAPDQAKVDTLLTLNSTYTERLLEALKHWGWCAMNGHKENYKHLGYGNKDLEWEKETVKKVDEFFTAFEEALAEKKKNGGITGYLTSSDRLTLADCALLNWAGSFKMVLDLNVEKRYPLVMENWELLKKTEPEGSKDHYSTFPIFCKIVGLLNARNRGTGLCCICGRGFYIENPVYWP